MKERGYKVSDRKRKPLVDKIIWKKYSNFFELWENHKNETSMFYVIGEKHHIYIGAIGINEGQQGLRNRYQKQYLDRSKAIFGKDEKCGQIAYAGVFRGRRNRMRNIEINLQQCCIEKYGADKVLFKEPKKEVNITIKHIGTIPDFLQTQKSPAGAGL